MVATASRSNGTTVAWHEVPGTASPPKGRAIGYGASHPVGALFGHDDEHEHERTA